MQPRRVECDDLSWNNPHTTKDLQIFPHFLLLLLTPPFTSSSTLKRAPTDVALFDEIAQTLFLAEPEEKLFAIWGDGHTFFRCSPAWSAMMGQENDSPFRGRNTKEMLQTMPGASGADKPKKCATCGADKLVSSPIRKAYHDSPRMHQAMQDWGTPSSSGEDGAPGFRGEWEDLGMPRGFSLRKNAAAALAKTKNVYEVENFIGGVLGSFPKQKVVNRFWFEPLILDKTGKTELYLANMDGGERTDAARQDRAPVLVEEVSCGEEDLEGGRSYTVRDFVTRFVISCFREVVVS